MKRLFINNLLWMATLIGLFASCMEKKDLYQEEEEPGENGTTLKPESAYFDFNLTRQVTVELDYGTWGGGSLFGIYTENPAVEAEGESDIHAYRSDLSTVATVFADKQGKYTGAIELPSYVEKIYVLSASQWLPDVVEANIVNNRATVKGGNSEWTNSRAATRMTDHLTDVAITTGNYKNLYSIVGDTWNEWGKADDPNGVMSTGTMTPDKLQQIYRKLLHKDTDATFTIGDFAQWISDNAGYANSTQCDNSTMVVSTDHVNCTIAKAFIDENGETQNVKDATICLTFINEAAAYMSTLGYYYYKTGECPASPNDVKKFMVFPNASVPSGFPFTKGNYRYGYQPLGPENAPIDINIRVQLLFEDENGNVYSKFPPGYTIGFFLIANSDGAGWNGDTLPGASHLKSGRTIHYSNNEWNTKQTSRYLALTATDGQVVYCIEDADDNKNFCDMLFCVDCDPSPALQDPDRPVIDPVTPITYVENTTTKSYAFEDQWPTGGDYDLNDVIVKHDRVISKTIDNLVVKITDRFTPVQPAGSATFRNAIAITGSSAAFGAVTSTGNGVVTEGETNSYILTTHANDSRGQTIEVVREFTSGISETAAEAADWEPYIISQYAPNAATRIEVHLPKHKATSKHNIELNGTADDAYYIDKNNMYPFSIEIPGNYKPAPESMRIDTAYPKYADWVKSNGSSDKDWYNHPSF